MAMLKDRRWRRRMAGLLCLLAVATAGSLASSPAIAAASQLKAPVQRTVLGTVINDSGQPVDKAVVYLQDQKTQIIRSYVTVNGGQFHFNQLSPDTDYQVWAELNKNRSKRKFISMFNSHLKFTYKLKLKS